MGSFKAGPLGRLGRLAAWQLGRLAAWQAGPLGWRGSGLAWPGWHGSGLAAWQLGRRAAVPLWDGLDTLLEQTVIKSLGGFFDTDIAQNATCAPRAS